MEFSEEKKIDLDALFALSTAVGWSAYTKDIQQLALGIQQSLEVITVWHEQQLIGLIRSVGDGETILYIQDLLVHPAYQNKGIGTQLIEKMVQAYPKVRQKVLLTENEQRTRRFYEKCQFQSVATQEMICFYREY
ncbi:GNAT family N-acetyltransferase [Enterococcus hirae]|uniref:GNAT family N-acetyltransferase n=1 Tax=Enterococcus hirae TaxID=1354 RepID=UPI002DBE1430|nr:GNAT family N-acetyltransferase [Enterococcus hirae]MEB7517653.1 GNAT family N-acetyltransferase [Enterococcus hirae]